jgi:lipoprotein-releasing system permease protein
MSAVFHFRPPRIPLDAQRPMPWPLFLSFRQLFPPKKFPVFATVSILGVALGVAALLIVQTVMNSFGEEHRRRIRDAVGDVVVDNTYGNKISDTPALLKQLVAMPGVKAVAPQVEGPVIIERKKDEIVFGMLLGVDMKREGAVSPLPTFIEDGKFDDLDDDRVILGSTLARRLGLYPGGKITLQSPTRVARSIGGEKLDLPKELEICGLLHSGFNDVDANTVLVTLRTARELQMVGPKDSSRIRLKLTDKDAAESSAIAANKILPENLEAKPWYLFRQEFLQAVAMEKQMLFLLMFIITLVASFSIGSTLFSHVVRRNREIGLLGALGAKPGNILSLYVSQGFLVGLFGYAIGMGLTFLILTFRQEIIGLIGANDVMLKQYKFDRVPLYYNSTDFVKAGLLTLGLMTVAALIPAIWASRRKPSEAMRDA